MVKNFLTKGCIIAIFIVKNKDWRKIRGLMTEDIKDFQLLADENLAQLCRRGIEAAERELISRHMQAIYWLPQRVFGAPEEELSGFLIFAVEKLRERDILGKFESGKGAKFSTWLGVVIRNLYLDYIRSQPDNMENAELFEDTLVSSPERRQERSELIDKMQHRCRVLFKLLLCDTYFIEPHELEWLAQESGKKLLDVIREIAGLEEKLRKREAKLQERYDKLARTHYWLNFYQRQLDKMSKTTEKPNLGFNAELEKVRGKLERRKKEYDNLAEELAGSGGIVTAPYKDLADIMNVREGTLASNISRCRAGAASLLRQMRNN